MEIAFAHDGEDRDPGHHDNAVATKDRRYQKQGQQSGEDKMLRLQVIY